MRIELEVWDLVHLNHIIAGLREKAVVSKVERVFDDRQNLAGGECDIASCDRSSLKYGG